MLIRSLRYSVLFLGVHSACLGMCCTDSIWAVLGHLVFGKMSLSTAFRDHMLLCTVAGISDGKKKRSKNVTQRTRLHARLHARLNARRSRHHQQSLGSFCRSTGLLIRDHAHCRWSQFQEQTTEGEPASRPVRKVSAMLLPCGNHL